MPAIILVEVGLERQRGGRGRIVYLLYNWFARVYMDVCLNMYSYTGTIWQQHIVDVNALL